MSPRSPASIVFYLGDCAAGGAQRQVVELLKHLDRGRFRPELCLATRDGPLLPEIPADVPVVAFRDPGQPQRSNLLNRIPGVTRFLRQRWLADQLRRFNADLVVDRTYLASLDTAGACRWRPTPRISTVVADPRVQFERYARFPRWLHRRLGKACYQQADIVVANSQGLQQQVCDYWQLPETAVRVIPNGLEWTRVEQLRGEFTVPKPMHGTRLLTIGRIDADKGHRDLLHALQPLVQAQGPRTIEWQVIGTGPLQDELLHEAQQLGLRDHLSLIPSVSNPFPYYAAADIYVLSSHSEGLPNVLIEALACGLPVIATDCQHGPREILDHGRHGLLVPVGDVPQMTAALEKTLSHLSQAKATADRAQREIRERFEIGRVVDQWQELFDATLAGRHRLLSR